MDFAAARRIAMKLPDVEEKQTATRVSLTIGGRLFACQATNKSAEPNSLMVRIGRAERERVLKEAPDIYYLTDHYIGYPAVLVRLAKVDAKQLKAILFDASVFVRES